MQNHIVGEQVVISHRDISSGQNCSKQCTIGRKATFCILVAILFLSSVPSSLGLDFSFTPNEDGSIDLFLRLEWFYTPFFFSAGEFETASTSDQIVDGTSYTDTEEKKRSITLDLIGYAYAVGPVFLSAVCGGTWENATLKELGYVDSFQDILFFNNDVLENSFKPSVFVRLDLSLRPVLLDFSCRYTPWFITFFSQDMTIVPGMPRTTYIDTGIGTHQLELKGHVSLQNSYLTPILSAEFTRNNIAFRQLTLIGPDFFDLNTNEAKITGTVVISFLTVNGVQPSFSYEYSWHWTFNNRTDSFSHSYEEQKILFGFALE